MVTNEKLQTAVRLHPGPWRPEGDYVLNAHGSVVCRIMGSAPYNRHAFAAILAVPELVAFAEFFRKYATMHAMKGDPLPDQLVQSCDTALAKAREVSR